MRMLIKQQRNETVPKWYELYKNFGNHNSGFVLSTMLFAAVLGWSLEEVRSGKLLFLLT